MDHTSIGQLQHQLAAFSDAVVTEKRERERLQNEMRVTDGQVKPLVIVLLYLYLIVKTNKSNVTSFTTELLVLSVFLKFHYKS